LFDRKLEVVERLGLQTEKALEHQEDKILSRAIQLTEAVPYAPGSPAEPQIVETRARSYSKLVPEKVTRVFLWDLDDTIVPWDSMAKTKLEGMDKAFFDEWFQLSKDWQQEHLFGDELKSSQLDALSEGMSANHTLASFEGMSNPPECLQAAVQHYPEVLERYKEEQVGTERLREMLEETDRLSEGWLAAGKEALEASTNVPGSINVIVTASKIMAAVAKLMMFKMNRMVDGRHIYSVWCEGSKQECFQHFKQMHPKAKFLAIGDGKKEEAAAKALKIEFVKINAQKGAKAAVADLHKLTKKFEAMAPK